MKFVLLTLFAVFAIAVQAKLLGQDVSAYQPNVNWNTEKSQGSHFAYIKATEGTGNTNSKFSSQYNGAYKAGIVRGAYHFARPDKSSGSSQATYFLKHGGGWSGDGKTLPGALDMEYNPYGSNKCFGLSQSAMVKWIKDFGSTYHSKTGRYPVIYTTTDWWKTCTGNSGSFGKDYPLWLARYASSAGALPNGWENYSFWQYADKGKLAGDQDYWNGDASSLEKFAKGSS